MSQIPWVSRTLADTFRCPPMNPIGSRRGQSKSTISLEIRRFSGNFLQIRWFFRKISIFLGNRRLLKDSRQTNGFSRKIMILLQKSLISRELLLDQRVLSQTHDFPSRSQQFSRNSTILLSSGPILEKIPNFSSIFPLGFIDVSKIERGSGFFREKEQFSCNSA